jgi:hypothetical protein
VGGIKPLYQFDPAGAVSAMARQYEDLWRTYVFCPAAKVAQVKKACERLLDLPSEYDSGD